jgi:hypothetical protein
VAASVLIGEQELEQWLADGRVRCPGCGGSLSPWGHARERQVRMLHGVRRPRRARCAPCERSHVLLPAWSVPRRRDGAEVIGHALLLKATDGAGHRTIAEQLGRSPGTVRGWLRAAKRRADALADCGTLWTIALGEETPRPTLRRRSALQHAVESLLNAALAWRLRFHKPGRDCPWTTVVCLTGGGLLHGRPARPPGY